MNLFSTGSDTSGFRLKYMEIYNWGTFHERIFRMEPQGNNALLTGANASGKSTIIDALLTLMVPAKKDRRRKVTEQRKHTFWVITEIFSVMARVVPAHSLCATIRHILCCLQLSPIPIPVWLLCFRYVGFRAES